MSGEGLVAGYLATLRAAAATLPASRQDELVSEVEQHIETALQAAGVRDEASVRNVLDRLGPPDEIVSAEDTSYGAVSIAADGGAPRSSTSHSVRFSPLLAALSAAVILLAVAAIVAGPTVFVAVGALALPFVALLLLVVVLGSRGRRG